MIAHAQRTEPRNLSTLDAQSISLTLTFNYNNGSPTMSWSTESVTVDQAIGDFTLSIVTTGAPSGQTATFNGTINWFNSDGGSIPQPTDITDVVNNSSTLTFTDDNPEDDVTWSFSVGVSFQGTSYTSPDPTIINADVGPPA